MGAIADTHAERTRTLPMSYQRADLSGAIRVQQARISDLRGQCCIFAGYYVLRSGSYTAACRPGRGEQGGGSPPGLGAGDQAEVGEF